MIVEIERVIAHEPDRLMPYLWTSNGDNQKFEAAAENDPSIEGLTKLDEHDGAVLYRANWVQGVEAVVHAYTKTGAVLIDATGRNDQWELQLRFDTEDDVIRFKSYLDESRRQFRRCRCRLTRMDLPHSGRGPLMHPLGTRSHRSCSSQVGPPAGSSNHPWSG